MVKIRISKSEPVLIIEGSKRYMVITDLHIGFEDKFSSNKIEMGKNSPINETINKIKNLIQIEKPETLILLGDIKSSIKKISNTEWNDIPKFFEEINYLGPFGSGNSEPKFVIENIKVISSNIVGNNHIKSILIGKDGSKFKSFAWNAKNSPLETVLNKKNKKKINIAGKMKKNEWRGKKNIEFIIEDVSLS